MDPDMKFYTEDNIFGLNSIKVRQTKTKKNISMYCSTWLDYIDKPVMVLSKYVNNLFSPFSPFSPSPHLSVNDCQGSPRLRFPTAFSSKLIFNS